MIIFNRIIELHEGQQDESNPTKNDACRSNVYITTPVGPWAPLGPGGRRWEAARSTKTPFSEASEAGFSGKRGVLKGTQDSQGSGLSSWGLRVKVSGRRGLAKACE